MKFIRLGIVQLRPICLWHHHCIIQRYIRELFGPLRTIGNGQQQQQQQQLQRHNGRVIWQPITHPAEVELTWNRIWRVDEVNRLDDPAAINCSSVVHQLAETAQHRLRDEPWHRFARHESAAPTDGQLDGKEGQRDASAEPNTARAVSPWNNVTLVIHWRIIIQTATVAPLAPGALTHWPGFDSVEEKMRPRKKSDACCEISATNTPDYYVSLRASAQTHTHTCARTHMHAITRIILFWYCYSNSEVYEGSSRKK